MFNEPEDADVLSDCESVLVFMRFEDDVLAKELKFVLGTVIMLEVGEEGMAIAPLLRKGGDCNCGCEEERTSGLSVRACGMGEGSVELEFECASLGEYSELELFDELAVRFRGLSGPNKGNAARFGALLGALVIREGVLAGKLFGCT